MNEVKMIGEIIDTAGIRDAILVGDIRAIAILLGRPSAEWGESPFISDERRHLPDTEIDA